MTAKILDSRLAEEGIAVIDAAEWAAVASEYETLERHDTCFAGDLLIVRGALGVAAVERPAPGQRVVRLLEDPTKVREFVRERLDTYDRMWDGCGCKVDYFG